MRGNVWLILLGGAAAWVTTPLPRTGNIHKTRSAAPRATTVDDQESLLAGLAARQRELRSSESEVADRWRSGECTSRIGFTLKDWVRRLALDWPLAAVGTASGGVYVTNLNTGKKLAGVPSAHKPEDDGEGVGDVALLHGEYDGGGVTAMAIAGQRIVSGGRDGAARVFQLERGETKLEALAVLPCNGVVSAVTILDDGVVWTGSLDGALRRWEPRPEDGEEAEECNLSLRERGCGGYDLAAKVSLSAPVLCLSCDPATGLLAAGTADGGATLLRLSDGAELASWSPHAGSGTRAVTFAQGSVVTGDTDGVIRGRRLSAAAAEGDPAAAAAAIAAGAGRSSAAAAALFDDAAPGGTEEPALAPTHGGAVMSLASTEEGILISGAQDGTIRIWDFASRRGPKCLYGFGGYKVWLGSVATDGKRLVADGSDNSVLVHDFSEEPPSNSKRPAAEDYF